MANNVRFLFLAFASCIVIEQTSAASLSPSGTCKGHASVQQNCRWVTGKLEVFNGTPAVRLTEKSTLKRFAIGPAEEELMPASIKEKLTPETEIQGEFKVCPFKQSSTHGFKTLCIDQVRKH